MKITNFDPSNIKDDVFNTYISRFAKEVIGVLNAGIALNDNINGKIVSVEFTATNTEVRIDHNLNRIPSGYIQLGQSAAMTIYDGTTATTNSTIFLRSNAVGTVKLLIT